MTIEPQFVETPNHGRMAYRDTGGAGPVAVLIHGNSASSRMFARQLESDLAKAHRLIAVDLPGHGQSEDAPDPALTYCFAGFADAVMEALDGIGVTRGAVVGWSLGGHVALEMLARWLDASGAFIFGTPPIPNDPERAMAAFLPSEMMELTFKESFTREDAAAYAGMNFIDKAMLEDWMVDDAQRADGRFRPLMFQAALEGRNLDEEEIATTNEKPLAVVIGGQDGFVNQAFLTSIAYKHAWGGGVHVLPGRGHAPFWEAPEEFNELLGQFLHDTIG